jgi:carboxymethylenebutenolidase
MDRKITDLYKDYRNGGTDRRSFLKKLTLFAGGTAAALALLPVLEENELKASTPPQDDSDLVTTITIHETGEIGPILLGQRMEEAPAVIMIHENRDWFRTPGRNKKWRGLFFRSDLTLSRWNLRTSPT